MDELTLKSVVAKNEEIVTADMDGETVMMSIENGKYYNLGQMGSVVWEMLNTPLTVDALIDKLVAEYAVSRETCEEEVLSFLIDMQKERIVSIN